MKKGKLVAPILVTAFLVLWFGGWIVLLLFVPGIPLILKLAGALVPLSLLGVSVFVMIERIKEIRSGEEDDLSNY